MHDVERVVMKPFVRLLLQMRLVFIESVKFVSSVTLMTQVLLDEKFRASALRALRQSALAQESAVSVTRSRVASLSVFPFSRMD